MMPQISPAAISSETSSTATTGSAFLAAGGKVLVAPCRRMRVMVLPETCVCGPSGGVGPHTAGCYWFARMSSSVSFSEVRRSATGVLTSTAVPPDAASTPSWTAVVSW